MNDLTGKIFKRWTVIRYSHADKRKTVYWLCKCACGVERPVRAGQLTRGISKSCGCWKIDVAREQIIRLSTTHGQAPRQGRTRTYGIWKGMRKRCNNPADKAYPSYGGRGITVCKRWDNYANFLADMGEVPFGYSIDRINCNGNYEPSNCRWTDKLTQANNTRSNIYFKHNGELLTLKQWADKIGIPYLTLYQRIFKLGWPFSKAIVEPIQSQLKHC